MSKSVNWRQLKEFIDQQVEKEGDKWLDNELYIECQGIEHINPSFETIKDCEDWHYTKPAWEHGVLTTTFKKKKIVSLNINY